jgi:hypothetical protein
VQQERSVLLDYQVLMEQPDHKELMEQRGHKDLQDLLELMVQPDLRDRQV